MDVQRSLAHAVAGQVEQALARVMDGEGEIAVDPFHAGLAPAQPGLQDQRGGVVGAAVGGIGRCRQGQGGAQFCRVVQARVGHHHAAAFRVCCDAGRCGQAGLRRPPKAPERQLAVGGGPGLARCVGRRRPGGLHRRQGAVGHGRAVQRPVAADHLHAGVAAGPMAGLPA